MASDLTFQKQCYCASFYLFFDGYVFSKLIRRAKIYTCYICRSLIMSTALGAGPGASRFFTPDSDTTIKSRNTLDATLSMFLYASDPTSYRGRNQSLEIHQ